MGEWGIHLIRKLRENIDIETNQDSSTGQQPCILPKKHSKKVNTDSSSRQEPFSLSRKHYWVVCDSLVSRQNAFLGPVFRFYLYQRLRSAIAPECWLFSSHACRRQSWLQNWLYIFHWRSFTIDIVLFNINNLLFERIEETNTSFEQFSTCVFGFV